MSLVFRPNFAVRIYGFARTNALKRGVPCRHRKFHQ